MPAGQARIEPAAQAEYNLALESLRQNPGAGRKRLQEFVSQRPRSGLADDAAYLLAKIAYDEGDLDTANKQLRWLLRIHPNADRSDQARLLLAKIEAKNGNGRVAYNLARSIRGKQLSPAERRQRYELLANTATDLGENGQALRWLAYLEPEMESQSERELLAVEMDRRIAALSRKELERLAPQLGRGHAAARAHLRAADLALQEGDVDAARNSLARASELYLNRADAAYLERLANRVVGWRAAQEAFEFPDSADPLRVSGARGVIGVILPLSGPFAAFGEECLDGILLASETFETRGSGTKVQLLVRDSQGKAEQAVAAVEELAADPQVVAIVGPLLGGESKAAADAAERLGVPLVVLSAREELAAERNWVIRMGRSPRGEVQRLVEYSRRQVGHQRFAILYPADAYGRNLRKLFWQSVESSGGEVVAVASYPPGANDFTESIKSLVGFVLLSAQQEAALRERKTLLKKAKKVRAETASELRQQAALLSGPDGEPLPPFVDFDAIFIPDSHEKVALIAPQLVFHEVQGVQLLGPHGWNHPELIKIAGRHVEGAVFAEAFFPQSQNPVVKGFIERFSTQVGRLPGALSAQAFDATHLVIAQLRRPGADREGVRSGILQTPPFSGVSGITTISADGNAQKYPYLLGVHRRQIVPLNDSASLD